MLKENKKQLELIEKSILAYHKDLENTSLANVLANIAVLETLMTDSFYVPFVTNKVSKLDSFLFPLEEPDVYLLNDDPDNGFLTETVDGTTYFVVCTSPEWTKEGEIEGFNELSFKAIKKMCLRYEDQGIVIIAKDKEFYLNKENLGLLYELTDVVDEKENLGIHIISKYKPEDNDIDVHIDKCKKSYLQDVTEKLEESSRSSKLRVFLEFPVLKNSDYVVDLLYRVMTAFKKESVCMIYVQNFMDKDCIEDLYYKALEKFQIERIKNK